MELAEVLRELRPRMLFVPYAVDAHPDHIAASSIAVAARFYAQVHQDRDGRRAVLPASACTATWRCTMRIVAEPSFVVDVTRRPADEARGARGVRVAVRGEPEQRAASSTLMEQTAAMWGALGRCRRGRAVLRARAGRAALARRAPLGGSRGSRETSTAGRARRGARPARVRRVGRPRRGEPPTLRRRGRFDGRRRAGARAARARARGRRSTRPRSSRRGSACRSKAPGDPEALIVMTGHQPELYHPGVWVKDFLLQRLADETGAAAVDLVVDSDGFDAVAVICAVPDARGARAAASTSRSAARTRASRARRCPSARRARRLLRGGGRDARDAAGAGGPPALRGVLRRSCAARRPTRTNLAELVTFARRRYEAAAGTRLPRAAGHRSSRAREAFATFVADIALSAPSGSRRRTTPSSRSTGRVNKTRSAAQPFPDLGARGRLGRAAALAHRRRTSAGVRVGRGSATAARASSTRRASTIVALPADGARRPSRRCVRRASCSRPRRSRSRCSRACSCATCSSTASAAAATTGSPTACAGATTASSRRRSSSRR